MTTNVDNTSPVEFPRVSAEITADLDDLRLRALRGESISVEEYHRAIKKLRELFGRRMAAREADVKPKRTVKASKPKGKTIALDDLLL